MAFPPTSFRFDPALLARIDRYAEQLSKETGLPVTRQAAMAKLINAGLLQYSERPSSKRTSVSRASRR